MSRASQPVQILLVEDNVGDVRLTIEALREAQVSNTLHVACDGVEAIDFLRRRGKFAGAPRPDVVLLDLNLPRMDGRAVLSEIKADEDLKRIPVVVLTTSIAEGDVMSSYELHANCYVNKPVDLDQFVKVIQSIDNFWFNVAKLPRDEA